MTQFDILGDIKTEQAGGFFCQACLVSKPLDDVSSNPRYCQRCYKSLYPGKAESKPVDSDYWASDGAVFVHYGKGYVTTPSGGTACIGEYPPPDVSQNTPQTTPEAEKVVAKPPGNGIAPIVDIQAQKDTEVLQQKIRGGRPRKEGEVHRVTRWRRKKQGLLI